MSSSTTRTGQGDATPSTLSFADLALDERILRAVAGQGFDQPTPIQAEAIPPLMEGRDIIGGARTGSGKTAAFGLPLLHHMREGGRHVRALVLCPTRELAIQVAEALDAFARHLPAKILTIYGGVGYQQQLRGLKQGVSVVVGTPGRVLDHVSSGALDLSHLEMFVLDEADEMLQMGFVDDIERVLKAAPNDRQIALFSATMPSGIQRVAKRYLKDPVQVQVESQGLSASHVTQRWLKVAHRQKTEALIKILMAEPHEAALIFARTRASVANLATELNQQGFPTDALHGDLSQAARELVLSKLRSKQVSVVVATDVAARGLDVDHITHVFNYDMPENSETYVHRIGRTARAGRQGWAISFASSQEQSKIKQIQRDIGQRIETMYIPTEAQIAVRQRAALINELDRAMDASGAERAEAWLGELLDETGWGAQDVAAAALSLLAIERNFDLRRAQDKPRQAPIEQTRSQDREEDDNFASVNEVELFFPVGRRDGLRPADFVGALCNHLGMSSSSIGRITLGGHKTFVGLPRQIAQDLITTHVDIEVRGNTYPLQLSFDSKNGKPASSAPQEQSYGGGGGGGGSKPKYTRSAKKPYAPKSKPRKKDSSR